MSDTVCTVSLKDPTGTIKGHIHNLAMDQFPTEIVAGAVLVLRKVAVFSPSPFDHILNITCDNIVRVFDSKLSRPKEFLNLPPTAASAAPDLIYLSPTGRGVTFDVQSILSPKVPAPKPSANSSRSKNSYPTPARYPPPSPRVSLIPNSLSVNKPFLASSPAPQKPPTKKPKKNSTSFSHTSQNSPSPLNIQNSAITPLRANVNTSNAKPIGLPSMFGTPKNSNSPVPQEQASKNKKTQDFGFSPPSSPLSGSNLDDIMASIDMSQYL